MRVICPGCGAIYAVGEGMIPADGRDVACSACGAEWRVGPGDGSGDGSAREVSGEAGQAVRSTVTPEVAEILRAEAAREQAARASEQPTRRRDRRQAAREAGQPAGEPPGGEPPGGGPEKDLAAAISEMVAREETGDGVAAAALAVPAAQLRPAEPPAGARPAKVAPASVTPAQPEPKAEPQTEPRPEPGPEPGPEPAGPSVQARSGRGFRIGFWAVVVIACALALVHVFAPRIVATVPAAAPAVAAYSEAVEGARSWVGERWQELRGATGTAGPAGPAEE